MDFLQLAGKTVLVCGLANRKSVAWHIGRVLAEAGAKPVFVVRTGRAARQHFEMGWRFARFCLRCRVSGADCPIGRRTFGRRRPIGRPGAFDCLRRLRGGVSHSTKR